MSSPANHTSAAASSFAAAATAASRKRPRHFHQGPDEAEEEQREEAAAAHPPTVRLYKHALESIFGFLSLPDLSRVIAVSRSWSDAVSSMRSIGAAIESLPIDHPIYEMCASGLARHIGTLGSDGKRISLSLADLYVIGLRMTGLHTLYYKLPSPLAGQLILPPSLTSLVVDPSRSFVQDASSMIAAVGRLPKLSSLRLCNSEQSPLLSFAALRHSTQLQRLSLSFPAGQRLSPQQADQLRAIPHLTDLDVALDADELRLLLRAPHELPLQVVTFTGDVDSELAALLASLPQLTDLGVYSWSALTFLQSLPNLHALEVLSFALQTPLPEPKQFIAGVGQCKLITQLRISDSMLTSAHMRALLSCMPAVRKLHLKSLSFHLSQLAESRKASSGLEIA